MADVNTELNTPGAEPTASDHRRLVNQQNAQHSTGPRTPAGKARSSRNAIRHGLRSARVVLPDIESEEEWAEFRDEYLAELVPVGRQENDLAERIAGLTWRLQRVEQVEAELYAAEYDPAREGGPALLPSEKTMTMICRNEAHLSRELDKARKALDTLQQKRKTAAYQKSLKDEEAARRAKWGMPAPSAPAQAPPPGPAPRTAAELRAELDEMTKTTQQMLAAAKAQPAAGQRPGVGSIGKNTPAASYPAGDASGQAGSVSSIGQRPASEGPGSASPPA